MLALPDLATLGRAQQARELLPVEHVREHLPLLRRPQDERGIAVDVLALEQEAEEGLECRDRARLARRCRPRLRFGAEKAAQIGRLDERPVAEALALQEARAGTHVALVGRAGELGQAP